MDGNAFSLGTVGKLTIGILLVAVLPLPYSYYMFLRWAVTLSAALHLAHAVQRKLWGVVVVCTCITVLFNPIAPVYLTKGVWAVLDIAAAALFGYAYEMLGRPPETPGR